jgi:hypothetical protein
MHGMNKIATKCKWVALIDNKLGWIAFEWRERETTWLDELPKACRRGDTNAVTRFAQAPPKSNVGKQIAARTTGEKSDGF